MNTLEEQEALIGFQVLLRAGIERSRPVTIPINVLKTIDDLLCAETNVRPLREPLKTRETE